MRTNLFDRSNQVIGWTVEDSSRIRLYDRTGRFLGWYDKKTEITHTTHGFFGCGNQVLRLLR